MHGIDKTRRLDISRQRRQLTPDILYLSRHVLWVNLTKLNWNETERDASVRLWKEFCFFLDSFIPPTATTYCCYPSKCSVLHIPAERLQKIILASINRWCMYHRSLQWTISTMSPITWPDYLTAPMLLYTGCGHNLIITLVCIDPSIWLQIKTTFLMISTLGTALKFISNNAQEPTLDSKKRFW